MKWQITANKFMATAEANIQKKIRTSKKVLKEENLGEYIEILDENTDAESKRIKAIQIKQSSEEDLDSLLKLAEDLKEKVDKSEQHISRLKNYSTIFIFFGVAIIIFRFFAGPKQFLSETDIFFIFLIFVSLGFLLVNYYFISLGKKNSLPNKLALKEVLQLLREVHGTIAERGDWSILKRAEFRIRLSRFDLSEKKDSVFSFFS
jgi:VIT1/CCC1 family predicted Fe2+/Mn2+ transporter